MEEEEIVRTAGWPVLLQGPLRLLEQLANSRIHRINETAFGTSRHQGTVGVPNDAVGQFCGSLWVFGCQLAPTVNALVGSGTGGRIGHHSAVPDDKIRTDDHSDVIDLEPLTGVDAADLANRVGLDNPKASICRQIPARLKLRFWEFDVPRQRLFLALPFPTVPGHQPSAVLAVPSFDGRSKLGGAIKDSEIVVEALKYRIRGIADPQGIVQPRQISIATLAPKLALQPHYRDVGIEPSSPTLDGIGRADVFQRDPLSS